MKRWKYDLGTIGEALRESISKAAHTPSTLEDKAKVMEQLETTVAFIIDEES